MSHWSTVKGMRSSGKCSRTNTKKLVGFGRVRDYAPALYAWGRQYAKVFNRRNDDVCKRLKSKTKNCKKIKFDSYISASFII